MVLEKMKQILSEQLDADIDSITPETDIADDLGADSLDVVEMLMAIEDEFDIEISPAELIPDNFNSAKRLWDMICRLGGDE